MNQNRLNAEQISSTNAIARSEIVQVVQRWGRWRDDGQWDLLRSIYAPDGLMTTSWRLGTADEFVDSCMEASKKGARPSMHSIGASLIEINGDKALCETRRVLHVRGTAHGVEVDVTNHGRTFDRFVKHEGQWRIKQRNGIYERDRMDAVDPSASLKLDPAELAKDPEGYRYLGYLQAAEGASVNPALPTPGSAELTRLYEEGRAWFAQ